MPHAFECGKTMYLHYCIVSEALGRIYCALTTWEIQGFVSFKSRKRRKPYEFTFIAICGAWHDIEQVDPALSYHVGR